MYPGNRIPAPGTRLFPGRMSVLRGRIRPAMFHADLHIHSKFSRACSKDCDLEHLTWWARRKGVTVMGTGDFTHPAWCGGAAREPRPGGARAVPAPARTWRAARAATPPAAARGDGAVHAVGGDLHDLQARRAHPQDPPPGLRAGLRRGGRVHRGARPDRQPDLGRPAHPRPRLARPAGDHPDRRRRLPTWCPRTSGRRGSPSSARKSGFDTIEECYGDLADHIFALETGLSSDPAMNWRVSAPRPLPAGQQLRRALAADARPRGHGLRHRPRLLRDLRRRCAPATGYAGRSSSSPKRASTTSTGTASATSG